MCNPCVVFSTVYSHRHANLAAYTKCLFFPLHHSVHTKHAAMHRKQKIKMQCCPCPYNQDINEEVQFRSFVTLAQDWYGGSASRPDHFTPWVKSPVPVKYTVRWAPGPVWTVLKRKIYYPHRKSNPGSASSQPNHYSDSA